MSIKPQIFYTYAKEKNSEGQTVTEGTTRTSLLRLSRLSSADIAKNVENKIWDSLGHEDAAQAERDRVEFLNTIGFKPLPELIALQKNLLAKYEQIQQHPGVRGVAIAYESEKDNILKPYVEWINNSDNVMSALDRLYKTNCSFSTLATAAAAENNSSDWKTWVSSIVIKPVQRTVQYTLFFKELLKATPEGHPERESLLRVQKEAEELALKVNENKREDENQKALMSIQLRTKRSQEGLYNQKGDHNFELVHLSAMTWCNYCKEFIWGLSRQAYKCDVCPYTVHKKCADVVRSLPEKDCDRPISLLKPGRAVLLEIRCTHRSIIHYENRNVQSREFESVVFLLTDCVCIAYMETDNINHHLASIFPYFVEDHRVILDTNPGSGSNEDEDKKISLFVTQKRMTHIFKFRSTQDKEKFATTFSRVSASS